MRRLSAQLILVLALLVAPVLSAATEPTKSYASIDVVLYSTSWCPYCAKARDVLKEMGVSLTEYDIEKDPGKHAEMLEKSGGSRGVPVIDVEGIIMKGYSAEAIRAAVEKQRRK
jgi:glutaredoxin